MAIRILGFLVGLSLIANGVMGVILYNHREVMAENRSEVDDDVASVEERVDFVRVSLDGLRRQVAGFEEFDPSSIDSKLALLRSDVRFLEGSTNRLWRVVEVTGGLGGSTSVTVDAVDIEKPFLCFRGDVAVWDFQGLTC